MTQLLERALEEIRKLSPAGQDAIASIILEEIQDEELWDETFARTQDKLARMAAKAREDIGPDGRGTSGSTSCEVSGHRRLHRSLREAPR
jgi:hypothetical protein